MRAKIHFMAVAFAFALSVHGQGAFQNLDFESALLVPIPNDPFGRVQFSAAFPNWIGYVGTNVQTEADLNDRLISQPGISIMRPDFPAATVFEGHFYAVLYLASPGPSLPLAITQIGKIPDTAKSIRFYGGAYDPPFVSFAGQQIPVSALASTTTYTIFGGDISGFAGQTGELRFSGSRTLDNIVFSSQVIPEPGELTLFALGSVLLSFWLRSHSKA